MAEPVRYRVDLSGRHQHLVTVEVTFPDDLAAGGRLVLATWTPGSYVRRDYAHHVQQVRGEAGGAPVPVEPDGHTAWRLPPDVEIPAAVTFELYANELTVRTNHVDDHHALLIPAATFPLVEGARDRRHEVQLVLPEGWRAWALLPRGDDDVFVADGFDHLVDSAFEAGDHEEVSWEVAGVPHRFVWAGHAGRPDLTRLAEDGRRIGQEAVALFDGELPTDGYTFLCVGWDQGGGGLEHRDGAVLMVPVRSFQQPDRYRTVQTLLAHEYLHLWNVKRLVPVGLQRPDFTAPTHTESLWVAEGWTAYYDELLPLRAGLWSVDQYLQRAGDLVTRVLERPGRHLQSVRQASHEAWTKFYVRDENSPNVGVSYYDHGAVLAWSLDLLLRREAPDSDGLDDVLRLLWRRHRESGYTEDDVEAAVAEVAAGDLTDFFRHHVAGTEEPPVLDLLDVVGLQLVDAPPEDGAPVPPRLGVETTEDDQGVVLASVLRGGPGWEAGLTGGDRLLALDRTRVGRGELEPALAAHEPGETVEVAVLRGPRLLLVPVTLGARRPARKLQRVGAPTDAQRAAFARWSGQSWPAG